MGGGFQSLLLLLPDVGREEGEGEEASYLC